MADVGVCDGKEDEKSAAEMFRLYRKILQGKWKQISIDTESENEITGSGDAGRFRLTREANRVMCVEGL